MMIRHLLISCASLALATAASAADKSWMIENFESISVGGSHDVIVTTGKSQRVVATGDQDALDQLDVEVRGRTLKIETRSDGSGWLPWSSGNGRVRIEVTVPVLTEARLGGSGDMAISMMKGEDITLSLSGAGDMSVGRIEAENVKLSIAGSGDMVVNGICRTATYKIAGSGMLDASRLDCKSLDASVAGSGDIAASATEAAKVSVAGSGDVDITGGAKCETKVAGSGRVNCG
ncbi:MAG: head GIN domain-containing protein [Pacificimonas sp.]